MVCVHRILDSGYNLNIKALDSAQTQCAACTRMWCVYAWKCDV